MSRHAERVSVLSSELAGTIQRLVDSYDNGIITLAGLNTRIHEEVAAKIGGAYVEAYNFGVDAVDDGDDDEDDDDDDEFEVTFEPDDEPLGF